MSSGAQPSPATKAFRKDQVLVAECLLGNEAAWSELIEKYKNLIFSIPIKYGLSSEDAAEIFQSVCFTLLRELSQLREPQALAAWLIRLTGRKCIRWKQERDVFVDAAIEEDSLTAGSKLPEEMVQEIEREQMLRETLSEMSPECNRLITLLFFANPPLRYEQVAAEMGFAIGSIGATRMRCLEKLRSLLNKKGFR